MNQRLIMKHKPEEVKRGFEMKWAEFANFMVKNGKAV